MYGIPIWSTVTVTVKWLELWQTWRPQNAGLQCTYEFPVCTWMSMCVYKAIDPKSPIFYHSGTTFCNLDFCVKSTENCICHFSHYSMQCCNIIWNSKIRSNHKVHPCGGVYVSSTGHRMWKKDETRCLRKADSQEIYIFDKGAQFKTDPI